MSWSNPARAMPLCSTICRYRHAVAISSSARCARISPMDHLPCAGGFVSWSRVARPTNSARIPGVPCCNSNGSPDCACSRIRARYSAVSGIKVLLPPMIEITVKRASQPRSLSTERSLDSPMRCFRPFWPGICRALPVVFALAVAPVHAAAAAFDISGRVIGIAGNPIKGASLELVDSHGDTDATTATDSEGNFSLSPSSSGQYQLVARVAGFQPVVKTLILSAAEEHYQVNFTVNTGETESVLVTSDVD